LEITLGLSSNDGRTERRDRCIKTQLEEYDRNRKEELTGKNVID
jgi:hypothetical protein